MVELAWRIPERIGSLVLAVTTPGGWFWNNIPPVIDLFYVYLNVINIVIVERRNEFNKVNDDA